MGIRFCGKITGLHFFDGKIMGLRFWRENHGFMFFGRKITSLLFLNFIACTFKNFGKILILLNWFRCVG